MNEIYSDLCFRTIKKGIGFQFKLTVIGITSNLILDLVNNEIMKYSLCITYI